MKKGLIKDHTFFQMHLEKISNSSGVGSGSTGQIVSLFRGILGDLQVGISLAIYNVEGIESVQVDIPSFGLSATSLGYGDLTLDMSGDIYVDEYSWYVFNCIATFRMGGGLLANWVLGDLDSTQLGKAPSMIPLIGIPPILSAGGYNAVPLSAPSGMSLTSKPISFPLSVTDGVVWNNEVLPASGSNSYTGSYRGGWRWDVGGAKETFSTLASYITPPGIACSVSATPLPNIVTTDTWDNTVEASGTGSWDNLGNVEVTGQSCWIQPTPDLVRKLQRIGNDYAALCVRYSLPDSSQFGISRCGVSQNQNSILKIPARSYLLSTVQGAPHAYEDALNDRPECLYYRESFHGIANISTGIMNEQISQSLGAGSPPTGYIPILNSTESVTRYWDFLCNPHWSHKLWFEDWNNWDVNDYWSPIKQQWIYNAALPVPEQLQTRNNIILDIPQAQTPWHEAYVSHNARLLGVSRFQVLPKVLKMEHTYGPESASLWTATGAVLTFNSTTITINPD